MENNKEKIYKSSEAQRAANRRYREKIKDTAEYKEKVKTWHKNYVANNREKCNEYQKEYQRTIFYPNKRLGEKNKKYFENEIDIFLPNLE